MTESARKSLEKRNYKNYNKIVSSEKPINNTFHDLTGEIIRDIKVDKFLGINKAHRATYKCHCTKCNQELIISSHMFADTRMRLCYCDLPDDYIGQVSNFGNYSKKKYEFDFHDPNIKPLYEKWVHMRQRCNCPNDKKYPHNGRPGIKVCPEWDNNEDGFLNFYHWAINAGWKPNCGLSIDRRNVDKGYFPENCRWADNELQGSNQTSNRYIQYNCWVFSMNIWAKIAEIDYYKFYNRFRKGWDFERAIFTDTKFSKDKMITVPNEFEIYNKYQEWVDDGKIPPVQLPLSTTFPVINYFNIDKKK